MTASTPPAVKPWRVAASTLLIQGLLIGIGLGIFEYWRMVR